MSRKLRNLTIVILIFFAAINCVWYYGCIKITSVINSNFANKDIEVGSSLVRFSKATISGYLHKITIQLQDFKGTTAESKITYAQPIEIGYSLFTQKIFASYKGKTVIIPKDKAANKSIKLGGEYSFNVFYPLTPGLIKTLLTTKDYFELINYAKNFQLNFDKVKAYNISSNKKIFDLDHLKIILTPELSNYYKSLPELIANLPQACNIEADVKINKALKHDFSSNSPFFLKSIYHPFEMHIAAKVSKDEKLLANNQLSTEYSVNIDKWNSSSEYFESKRKLASKYITKGKKSSLEISLISNDLVKKEFSQAIAEIIEVVYIDLYKKFSNSKASNIDLVVLKAIKDNPDKFIPKLHELGRMTTQLQLKVDSGDNLEDVNIKKFSFINDLYSLELSNLTKAKADFSIDSNGKLTIKKYKDFIDILLGYVQRVASVIPKLDNSPQWIYNKKAKELLKKFLKQISNDPKTDSNDLYMDLSYSNQPYITKIGSVSLEQAQAMFGLMLAQTLLEDAVKSKDPKKILEKLIPKAGDKAAKPIKDLLNGIKDLKQFKP